MMDNSWATLVQRAQTPGAARKRALKELSKFAMVDNNRVALYAFPGLLPTVFDVVSCSFSQAGKVNNICHVVPALELLHSLALEYSLRRELYVTPGFIDAVIQCCEAPHDIAQLDSLATETMRWLLYRFANKVDFVRDGSARRITEVAAASTRRRMRDSAGLVLSMCISMDDDPSDEDADYDSLCEEFFRVPGLMSVLLRVRHEDNVQRTLVRLAECERISDEMLAEPGLVNALVCLMQKRVGAYNGIYNPPFEALARLLSYIPMRALQYPSPLIAIASMAGDEGTSMELSQRMHDFLIGLQLELLATSSSSHNYNQLDRSNAYVVVQEGALYTFWSNLPRLWALLSSPANKQRRRSPLRRLPLEMFRLLKDVLCGSVGKVLV